MTVEHPHAPSVSTMVQLLRWRATHQPERVGYRYLRDGETDTDDLTYGELDRHCRAVAAWLQARSSHGDRVLMMFEEGHDYLHALYGCMYAKVLAVPVHPPDPARLHRTLPRLKNIAADAGVSLVLTTRDIAQAAQEAFADTPALAEAQWLCLDELDLSTADAWVDPEATADDIAYLQYTSGSTALPKGVMVSHHNLMHQLTDFDVGYEHGPDSVMVSWLPSTHDLGLVYGRFMPLFIGFVCVYMSPVHFMQRPVRWMQALSRFGGTHSPAPNFGFELAARRSSPEERAALDLSSVKVLLNGGEPIRKESEDAFIEAFAPHGLRRSAVTHAMGMSESTAKIVTEPIDRYPARFVHVDATAYENHEVVQVDPSHPNARTVASNGVTVLDTEVAIVDPDTRQRLGQGRVGELWVKGTTVARGYYGNPEATASTFQAHTSEGDGPFLRTGDMAFLLDDELYLSGRLKDVIIIRGQNHHPQDIEWTVGTVHPALRPNCAAAFSVPTDLGEQLVLVTEVYRHKVDDPEEVFAAIRQAIAEHGLAARSLVLMSPRTLPKTSSGKIQRAKAKRLFQAGEIDTLFRWDAAQGSEEEAPSSEGLLEQLQAAPARRRVAVMVDHLSGLAANLLGLDLDDIEPDRPLQELGIDSVTAVEMVERVGRAVGQNIPGTLLFDYPTIEAISGFIVDELLGDLQQPAVTATEAPMATAAADVAKMSDAEVEAALLAELDDL
jgi:acyl-CoA synthetase (AMP-forming)/AMP-acid ligase II/acyl carrier protein